MVYTAFLMVQSILILLFYVKFNIVWNGETVENESEHDIKHGDIVKSMETTSSNEPKMPVMSLSNINVFKRVTLTPHQMPKSIVMSDSEFHSDENIHGNNTLNKTNSIELSGLNIHYKSPTLNDEFNIPSPTKSVSTPRIQLIKSKSNDIDSDLDENDDVKKQNDDK